MHSAQRIFTPFVKTSAEPQLGLFAAGTHPALLMPTPGCPPIHDAGNPIEWNLFSLRHPGAPGEKPVRSSPAARTQFALLILALAGSTCSGQGRYLISGPEDLFSIHVPYQTVRLDNGLEIVLNEDHRTPIVAINLAYRVGWKDDPPGKTSLAHLYEHLMYLGSAHVAEGTVSRTLEKAGAFSFNARTAADSTVYWETVPANQLEVALWLESDRMGFLADSLNQHKLDQARSAVANEVVQRFEDADYGGVTDFVSAQLFPASHPYLGGRDRSEINTITLDDIRQFGQTYYIPNNASLTLSGDFDLAKTVALVDRYFGSIRPGKPPSSQPAPAVALGGDKFLRIAAAVPLNAVMIAWPTPAFGEAGDADLDVIAYTLRQATLPHAMMSVEPLASWVWARQYTNLSA